MIKDNGLESILSSFSALFYKMAAMSEQYFNQNEPKSHFKINMSIHMSFCDDGVGSDSRGGPNGKEFTAVLQKPLHHISISSVATGVQYVGTQVQVD